MTSHITYSSPLAPPFPRTFVKAQTSGTVTCGPKALTGLFLYPGARVKPRAAASATGQPYRRMDPVARQAAVRHIYGRHDLWNTSRVDLLRLFKSISLAHHRFACRKTLASEFR